jgi:hypothetical protein
VLQKTFSNIEKIHSTTHINGKRTANDYRRLLTIADPLTNGDKELCDLFIQNNEKVHGRCHPDTDQFVIKSYKMINNYRLFEELPELVVQKILIR